MRRCNQSTQRFAEHNPPNATLLQWRDLDGSGRCSRFIVNNPNLISRSCRALPRTNTTTNGCNTGQCGHVLDAPPHFVVLTLLHPTNSASARAMSSKRKREDAAAPTSATTKRSRQDDGNADSNANADDNAYAYAANADVDAANTNANDNGDVPFETPAVSLSVEPAFTLQNRPLGLILTPGASSTSEYAPLVAIDRGTPEVLHVKRITLKTTSIGNAVKKIVAAGENLADDLGCAPDRIAYGGRSFGGRACSVAVARGLPAAALVLMVSTAQLGTIRTINSCTSTHACPLSHH
jgi:hypothetical protein